MDEDRGHRSEREGGLVGSAITGTAPRSHDSRLFSQARHRDGHRRRTRDADAGRGGAACGCTVAGYAGKRGPNCCATSERQAAAARAISRRISSSRIPAAAPRLPASYTSRRTRSKRRAAASVSLRRPSAWGARCEADRRSGRGHQANAAEEADLPRSQSDLDTDYAKELFRALILCASAGAVSRRR
jgi:hypothetical protein